MVGIGLVLMTLSVHVSVQAQQITFFFVHIGISIAVHPYLEMKDTVMALNVFLVVFTVSMRVSRAEVWPSQNPNEGSSD